MKRNMFMANPEAVLLAMLGDRDTAVRAEAVELTRTVRQRDQSSDNAQIRPFKAPEVNMSADVYTELVNLRTLAAQEDMEPPFTRPLDDSELVSFTQKAPCKFRYIPSQPNAPSK